MEMISILYAVLAVIFIQTNSFSCRYAEMDNLVNPATKTESPQPPQKTIPTLPRNDLYIDPLSPKIFPLSTRKILTPEVFSQADPITYFFAKIANFSSDKIRLLSSEVDYYFTSKKFPHPYDTYAAVLTSLLKCLSMLHNVRWSIETIQKPYTRFNSFTIADISSPDPELSMFFTADIFADVSPPSVVLRKLLEIPEDEMPTLMSRLRNLLNSRSSNGTIRLCYNYMRYLLEFLDQCNTYALRSLRIRIRRMENYLSTINSTLSES